MLKALFGRQQAAGARWQEQIKGDEASRFAHFANEVVAFQRKHNRKQGDGRAVHRKSPTVARGTLSVATGLPEWAAQGLFAAPADYPAMVRLSNGNHIAQPDWMPDTRGFTFAVQQVKGDTLPDYAGEPMQCFLLLNGPAFPFAGPDKFVELVSHLAQGPLSLVRYSLTHLGIFGTTSAALKFVRDLSQPFYGFAANEFFSVTPFQNGNYAVKMRLLPKSDRHAGKPDSKQWGEEMHKRLLQGEVVYEVQLQCFDNEKKTPIEDASVEWKTPFVTVATLTLPKQDTEADKAFNEQVEQEAFSPWRGLTAHRPLGSINRARRAMYLASQRERDAEVR